MTTNNSALTALEEIHFKYERITALVDNLQTLIAEGPVEVVGLAENALDYSLYEIASSMHETNSKLLDVIVSNK